MYYLHQLLEQSRHNVELQILNYLTKYCEHCQNYGQLSERFAFTLQDDLDFNYNPIINIMYIEEKSVLDLTNKTSQFQAKS